MPEFAINTTGMSPEAARLLREEVIADYYRQIAHSLAEMVTPEQLAVAVRGLR